MTILSKVKSKKYDLVLLVRYDEEEKPLKENSTLDYKGLNYIVERAFESKVVNRQRREIVTTTLYCNLN